MEERVIQNTFIKCPIRNIQEKIGWASIAIDGAKDLEENFFPKYPDSKQPHLWQKLVEEVEKFSREELIKFMLDCLAWYAGLDIELSHVVAHLEEQESTENMLVLNTIMELIGSGE